MRRVWYRVLSIVVPSAVISVIYYAPQFAAALFSVVWTLAPLWLTPLLAYAAWPLWMLQVESQFVARVRYRTYELVPGAQGVHSARALESVLQMLYSRVDITKRERFMMGVVRVPWALEITAEAGEAHLFITVPDTYAPSVLHAFQSVYPDLDINEVDDYARTIDVAGVGRSVTLREYSLDKPDPYPLATYVDHERSKAQRDPFAELLTTLRTVGKGEHVWLQFLVRPHQRDWPLSVWSWRGEAVDTLHQDAVKEIQKLVGKSGDLRSLPADTRALVERIESGLKKPSYDIGVRALYFRVDAMTTGPGILDSLLDPFAGGSNTFSAHDPLPLVPWPLADILAAIGPLATRYAVGLYRARLYFTLQHPGKGSVLSIEELATLWRVPRMQVLSSSNTATGVKLAPPDNLPILHE